MEGNMKIRQYRLRSKNDPSDRDKGYREMTVWLEDERAKTGDSVTLRDTDEPEREWEVCEVYTSMESKELKDHRGFGESIQGRGSLRD